MTLNNREHTSTSTKQRSNNDLVYLILKVLYPFICRLPCGRKSNRLRGHTSRLGSQTKDRSLAEDRLKSLSHRTHFHFFVGGDDNSEVSAGMYVILRINV